MAVLNLYLAICKDTGGARHWILILAEEGAQNGTWYHVTGGPTQGRSYKLEIQTNRVDSHGIESHHFLGQIDEKDKKKFKSSAQKANPRFCQRWVVDVLSDLEKKHLVAAGTSGNWANYMQNDPYSDDGVMAVRPPVLRAKSGFGMSKLAGTDAGMLHRSSGFGNPKAFQTPDCRTFWTGSYVGGDITCLLV